MPAEPLLSFKPPSAVVGPRTAIVLPLRSRRVDCDTELAPVMGCRCRDVCAGAAWAYVLEVTCGNDVPPRGLQ